MPDRTVTLTIELPDHVAEHVEDLAVVDPDELARAFQRGLIHLTAQRHLQAIGAEVRRQYEEECGNG